MARFTDAEGDEWTVSITLGSARRIARDFGIDLLNPQHHNELVQQPTLWFELLFHLTSPQRAMLDVRTLDDFGDRLSGEAAENATLALYEAMANFTRRLGQNSTARELLKVGQSLAEAMKLDRTEPETETETETPGQK